MIPPCSEKNMDETFPPETSINIYQTAQLRNPEASNLYLYSKFWKETKFYIFTRNRYSYSLINLSFYFMTLYRENIAFTIGWLMNLENMVKELAEESEVHWENRPSATLCTTKHTWPDLGSNPGSRGGTNSLSYGTA
jgi:hypothetical protein